jgi:Family of unknown function (DUF6247)
MSAPPAERGTGPQPGWQVPVVPDPERPLGHTRRMATVTATAIGRSGPEIRQALAADDRARFEAEMRDALAHAADTFDLAVVERVLSRWHALATMAANPLTADEGAQVERVKAGDVTGLRTRDEQGTWSTL